jgi:hypothetical protein
MTRPEQSRIAPWVTAGIAGVILAALVVVYFVGLRPAKADASRPANGPGGPSRQEQEAMTAAAQGVANLQTFRRASFAADYSRALASTTGKLRSDVLGKRSLTQKTLTTGKFDTGSDVTNTALQGPSDKSKPGKGYIVLVSVDAYRSTDRAQTVPSNLAVEVVDVKGKWLLDDVESVGIQ